MQSKYTEKQDTESVELVESMIFGVDKDDQCVIIHEFDNDVDALEFMENMVTGFRADILSRLLKRTQN